MYQFPVQSLVKIRKTRKKVKSILSDYGLEECQSLCEGLQAFDAGDEYFDETDWSDLTDGFNGRRTKKWKYRTRSLCCSLCKFSARGWHGYESHVQRFHRRELRLARLSACSRCPFIAHPEVISKHYNLFHLHPASCLPSKTAEDYTFQCQKCPFQDSLLYCMKKHILMAHHLGLFNQYIRQGVYSIPGVGDTPSFFCQMCGVRGETSEHLVYHLLTSEKHRDLDMLIKGHISQVSRNASIDTTQPADSPANAAAKVFKPIVPAPPDRKTLMAPLLAASTVVRRVETNSAALVRVPGPAQPAMLPAQASAVVQLASAEAKGLLQPGTAVTLQNISAVRAFGATLPPLCGIAPPPTLQPTPPPTLPGAPPRHVLLPPGVQLHLPVRVPGSQSVLVTQRMPVTQPRHRGTILTSQSLLSHLVPTGHKVNGLPTYTFAPVSVSLPGKPSNGQVENKATLPTISQGNKLVDGSSQETQTKKWVTCPICNELFPSSAYQVHSELHNASAKKAKLGVAARAPFLQKMPDKTVKCLICKTLLSEKGVFEHLLHGLNCLYCPGMFHSMKQLVDHTQQEHSSSVKANRDFMRQEYRLYTNDFGDLLFPYFDIKTSASKDVMGERELNLALVTGSLDLIFLRITPSNSQPVCNMAVKPSSTDCSFCPEKLLDMESHQLHLRSKHCVLPAMHAILRTPAYKCIYCNGVYTGKTTTKAITVHISRCRCAPKTAKDAQSIMKPALNGQTVAAAPVATETPALNPEQPVQVPAVLNPRQSVQVPAVLNPRQPVQVPSVLNPRQSVQVPAVSNPRQPVQVPAVLNPRQSVQVPAVLNPRQPVQVPAVSNPRQPVQVPAVLNPRQPVQVPAVSNPRQPVQVPAVLNPRQPVQVPAMSKPGQTVQATAGAPTLISAVEPEGHGPALEAEMHSKLRLEMAVREAMEANKREREARMVRKRKLEKEKLTTPTQPSVEVDPLIEFALDCTGMELRSFEDRRAFLTTYFNTKPYLPKKELDALAHRLLLTKADVACHFGQKRTKCMKFIQRKQAAVLLGFNMAELRKVEHNLLVPEVESEETT